MSAAKVILFETFGDYVSQKGGGWGRRSPYHTIIIC